MPDAKGASANGREPILKFNDVDTYYGALHVLKGVDYELYDGEIVLQVEEVESGEFVPLDEILQRARTALYTPDGMYVLRRYFNLVDSV